MTAEEYKYLADNLRSSIKLASEQLKDLAKQRIASSDIQKTDKVEFQHQGKILTGVISDVYLGVDGTLEYSVESRVFKVGYTYKKREELMILLN